MGITGGILCSRAARLRPHGRVDRPAVSSCRPPTHASSTQAKTCPDVAECPLTSRPSRELLALTQTHRTWFEAVGFSSEIRLCNGWLDRISSAVSDHASRSVTTPPAQRPRSVRFDSVCFQSRSITRTSTSGVGSDLSAVFGPKNICFLCTADSAAGSRVGCGFCEELAGRRNCFQRLGKHGLHLAVRFLRRAGP